MGKYAFQQGKKTANTFSGGIALLAGLTPFESTVFVNNATAILYVAKPNFANLEENKAKENTPQACTLNAATGAGGYAEGANWLNGRFNTKAVEWPEVKETETYKWVLLLEMIAIELTAPVAVVKGDTFRINKEKLVIKPIFEI